MNVIEVIGQTGKIGEKMYADLYEFNVGLVDGGQTIKSSWDVMASNVEKEWNEESSIVDIITMKSAEEVLKSWKIECEVYIGEFAEGAIDSWKINIKVNKSGKPNNVWWNFIFGKKENNKQNAGTLFSVNIKRGDKRCEIVDVDITLEKMKQYKSWKMFIEGITKEAFEGR